MFSMWERIVASMMIPIFQDCQLSGVIGCQPSAVSDQQESGFGYPSYQLLIRVSSIEMFRHCEEASARLFCEGFLKICGTRMSDNIGTDA